MIIFTPKLFMSYLPAVIKVNESHVTGLNDHYFRTASLPTVFPQ